MIHLKHIRKVINVFGQRSRQTGVAPHQYGEKRKEPNACEREVHTGEREIVFVLELYSCLQLYVSTCVCLVHADEGRRGPRGPHPPGPYVCVLKAPRRPDPGPALRWLVTPREYSCRERGIRKGRARAILSSKCASASK